MLFGNSTDREKPGEGTRMRIGWQQSWLVRLGCVLRTWEQLKQKRPLWNVTVVAEQKVVVGWDEIAHKSRDQFPCPTLQPCMQRPYVGRPRSAAVRRSEKLANTAQTGGTFLVLSEGWLIKFLPVCQQLERSRKWEGQRGTRIQAGQRNRDQDATREVSKKQYVCAYRPFVTATKGAYDLRVLRIFPGAFPMTRLKMQKDILHVFKGRKAT